MTNKGKQMLLSKCAVCNCKNQNVSKKEASGWLSSSELKTLFTKTPLLGDTLEI